jgi:hypothetical protein
MQFHQDDQLEEEKSFDADVIDWKKHLNDGALSITRLSCSTGHAVTPLMILLSPFNCLLVRSSR